MTPYNIQPEWYFLIHYTILKILPCKVIGFLYMITTIMNLSLLWEVQMMCNLSKVCVLLSLLSVYEVLIVVSVVCLCYIGCQISTLVTILVGRVLSVMLHVWLLCMFVCVCRFYASTVGGSLQGKRIEMTNTHKHTFYNNNTVSSRLHLKHLMLFVPHIIRHSLRSCACRGFHPYSLSYHSGYLLITRYSIGC